LGPVAARAQTPPPLALEAGRSEPGIGPAMRFARDVGQPVAEIVAAWQDGALSADFAGVVAAADPYQPVWALVELQNTAPDTGGPPDEWILASDTLGLVALDVFLFRQDLEVEQLLAHDSRAAFDPGDYSVTRLHSAPLRLAAGERALLLVRMTFGAADRVDLDLETPADHQARGFLDGMRLAGFYAFLASSILFFAVFSATMKSGVGLSYAALLTLGLCFIAYLDQLFFRFLYPDRPAWHLPAGLSLLYLTCAHGFATAALSVRGGRLARGLLGLAVLSLAGLGLVLVLSPEVMAPASYVLLALMLGSHVLAVARWDGMRGARRPVFRLVSVIAFVGLGLMIALALVRLGGGASATGWTIKTIYAVLALGTMAGLSVGLVDLRREHAGALARELEAAQSLLKAEQDYSRARDLADRRRQQLASMSHDIKQPLASLRMTMEAMTRDQLPEIRDRLGEAFDYMQDLAQGHLDSPDAVDLPPSGPAEDTVEPYPLSLILDTVAQMFREEAVSKGLRLRVVPSSVQVTVPPLVMMRILSNLVSNAVKYTDRGGVLAGVRRGGAGGACLQVLDTGRGMSGAELARFREAGEKGGESTGHGLGLAICHEMAAEHGLALTARSTPGRGTVFSLRLPTGP
jgi:signal transduction histidine kinase